MTWFKVHSWFVVVVAVVVLLLCTACRSTKESESISLHKLDAMSCADLQLSDTIFLSPSLINLMCAAQPKCLDDGPAPTPIANHGQLVPVAVRSLHASISDTSSVEQVDSTHNRKNKESLPTSPSTTTFEYIVASIFCILILVLVRYLSQRLQS